MGKAQRYSGWSWEDLSGFEDLPTGDLDSIRRALLTLKTMESPTLETFFMLVLGPYYDCMWDGMKTEACSVVYRLSEQVPLPQRRLIKVYPKAMEGEMGWHTLEDWRQEWSLARKPEDIYIFRGQLPELPIC